MRHSTIAMALDTYGELLGDDTTTANARIAQLAWDGNGAQTERKSV
jgi:hypothetical protein